MFPSSVLHEKFPPLASIYDAVDIQSHGQKNQSNQTQVIIARRPGKRKTKKMEDKQINRCISGPSSAVRHNLGCLAPEGPEDFSVQLRSEFRSSVGVVHPSIAF